ncbi:MAG TPA: hypothetical protein V6C85_33990 [Allocoleopsis sp.]
MGLANHCLPITPSPFSSPLCDRPQLIVTVPDRFPVGVLPLGFIEGMG